MFCEGEVTGDFAFDEISNTTIHNADQSMVACSNHEASRKMPVKEWQRRETSASENLREGYIFWLGMYSRLYAVCLT